MSDPSQTTIGIDFGTTNTVVAITGEDGDAHVLSLDAPSGQVTAFRSALSFQTEPARGERLLQRLVEAGPWAIDAYVEEALDTRFIQSFKTFAAFTERLCQPKLSQPVIRPALASSPWANRPTRSATSTARRR